MIFDKTSDTYYEHDFDSSLLSIAEMTGTAASAFLIYLSAAYFSVLGDATTPGVFDTESMAMGMNTVDVFLDTFLGMSMGMSGDSSPASPGSMLLSPTTSVGGSALSAQSSHEPDIPELLEKIIDLLKHDAVPYNRVEKNAERVYNGIQWKQNKELFPTVYIEKIDDYEMITTIYGNSISSFINNLDILEASLEKGCSQSN